MGECGYSVWYMVCSGKKHSSSSSLSLSCRGTRMPAVCRRAPAVSPPALRASPLIRYGMHGEEKMEMSDTGKRQTMANGEAQSGHARDEASPFACKRCKSYPSLPRGGQPFWLSFLESCLHCPTIAHCARCRPRLFPSTGSLLLFVTDEVQPGVVRVRREPAIRSIR